MAQSGFTPISLYYSTTASAVPTAGNLINGELAINTNDGKLYYKDSGGVVRIIGTKGGVGTSSDKEVLFNNNNNIDGSANLVFDYVANANTKLYTNQAVTILDDTFYNHRNNSTFAGTALTANRNYFSQYNNLDFNGQTTNAFDVGIYGTYNNVTTGASGGWSIANYGDLYGAFNQANHTSDSNTYNKLGNIYGSFNTATSSGNASVASTVYGAYNRALATGSTSATTVFAAANGSYNLIQTGSANSNITSSYATRSQVIVNTGSTITNSYGFYHDVSGGGTITNNYGVYIADATASNYFAGKVAVGPASDITPGATGIGQLTINGLGYNGFIALDGSAMYVGHNANNRSLIFGTDETARMEINQTGLFGIGQAPATGTKLSITSAANISIQTTTTGLNGAYFTSTDAGASGMNIRFTKDSASPLAGDSLALLRFFGNDSSGASQEYARITSDIVSPTAGSEKGNLIFATTNGTITTRMTIDSDGYVTTPLGATQLVPETALATTSGTSKDFTGIPSWVKKITVIFNGVSTNAANPLQIQLGTGATPTYTIAGYNSISSEVAIGGGVGGTTSTFGLVVGRTSASSIRYGHMVITNITGNTWVASHTIGDLGTNFTAQGGGSIALAAALTAVRIIGSSTGSPADTFDAGSVNIFYE
jgi:hypothetical protein